ncbi:prolyl aminopeptidase [Stagnihabitans tardus]|uniref:Proline iminopeptidase n=1 Tax=Stagnihabitans tardus TaxID=2699202 RepID=A0AAE4YBP5_9RHOB|nr:prolyl aminopeptidase [Stagnihabitans tardus]NBZ88298.1 prolyl aminopeptidase [Stagnihabitans tardus]
MTPVADRRPLYPSIPAGREGRLRVSALHEIRWEESGNPLGKPVVVLHGGPGSGVSDFIRRGHDPARYRIISFDQRGCGGSTPFAELEGNTTWDLVADMEKLRVHLGVERWQVVGGSWGSTLALVYAISHPSRVTELVLRGIFMLRQEEVDWFYEWGGASFLFPEAFADYAAGVSGRGSLVAEYHRVLTGPDTPERRRAAMAWTLWEARTISLLPDPKREAAWEDDRFALAFARIENHYFMHRGFFDRDDWILAHADRLKDIPGVIIHGRYDACTPVKNAVDLAAAWPEARLVIIDDAGHTGVEPGIADAMVRATDAFA